MRRTLLPEGNRRPALRPPPPSFRYQRIRNIFSCLGSNFSWARRENFSTWTRHTPARRKNCFAMRLINKMLNFWCAKADSIRQSPCGDGSGGGHKVYFVAVYARDFTLSYHEMRPCGLPTTATNKQKTTSKKSCGN